MQTRYFVTEHVSREDLHPHLIVSTMSSPFLLASHVVLYVGDCEADALYEAGKQLPRNLVAYEHDPERGEIRVTRRHYRFGRESFPKMVLPTRFELSDTTPLLDLEKLPRGSYHNRMEVFGEFSRDELEYLESFSKRPIQEQERSTSV